MARPLDTFPPELLDMVAENLVGERETPGWMKDVCQFRLACRPFAWAGEDILAKNLTVLFWSPDPVSVENFEAVCAHPRFSKAVKEVVFLGDVASYRQYLEWGHTIDRDLLWSRSLLSDFPWQGSLGRWLYQTSARSYKKTLCEGVMRLKNLERVTYSRMRPSQDDAAVRRLGWNRRHLACKELHMAIDDDLREADDMLRDEHNEIDVQTEAAERTEGNDEFTEDWAVLKTALDVCLKLNTNGRNVDLRLVDVPLGSILSREPEVKLPRHVKLRALTDTLSSLTTLDLMYSEDHIDADSKWTRALSEAKNLRSLRLAWAVAQHPIENSLLSHIMRSCVWLQLEELKIERLDWFDDVQHLELQQGLIDPDELVQGFRPEAFTAFLLAHRSSLKSLRLRNILLGVGDVTEESYVEPSEPLRACLAQMHLERVQMLMAAPLPKRMNED